MVNWKQIDLRHEYVVSPFRKKCRYCKRVFTKISLGLLIFLTILFETTNNMLKPIILSIQNDVYWHIITKCIQKLQIDKLRVTSRSVIINSQELCSQLCVSDKAYASNISYFIIRTRSWGSVYMLFYEADLYGRNASVAL